MPFVVCGVREDGFAAGFLGCGFYACFFYYVEAVVQGVGVAEGEEVGEGGTAETAGDGFDVVGFGVFGGG